MYLKSCQEHRYTKTCNEPSRNMLSANVDQTSGTSSNVGFMRLICRRNNPNKETLIYITYILCHHGLNSYNLSCPQCKRTRMSWVVTVL